MCVGRSVSGGGGAGGELPLGDHIASLPSSNFMSAHDIRSFIEKLSSSPAQFMHIHSDSRNGVVNLLPPETPQVMVHCVHGAFYKATTNKTTSEVTLR